MNLKPEYTTQFAHDVKRLVRKHVDTTALREVVKLILADTADARNELRRRHNMHRLRGEWAGSYECHIANVGD